MQYYKYERYGLRYGNAVGHSAVCPLSPKLYVRCHCSLTFPPLCLGLQSHKKAMR
jgi:hypothetical protein